MKNKDYFNLKVFEALRFFIEKPYEEIHLRGFSRKLKISPNTAQRFLNLFLKESLIKEERKANLRYFKANLDNMVFRQIKKTYSIKKLQDSGLINLLNKEVSHIVLFGSAAQGSDDKNSDIDLLIISSKKSRVNYILSNLQRSISNEINSHIFSWAEWKKQAKINKAFYRDIIIKGINLLGEKPIVE